MADEDIPNPVSIPPEAVGGLLRLPHDLRAIRADVTTVKEGQRANSKRLEHLDGSVQALNGTVLKYIARAGQNDVEGATERGRLASRVARIEARMSIPDTDEEPPSSSKMKTAKKVAPYAGVITVVAGIIAAVIKQLM